MASRNCHGRQLKWSICLSEQVGELKDAYAKLMFTWMIPTVDNLGRMEGEPYQVRGLIFPRENVTDKQIEKWLKELHESGLIIWYSHRGLRYVFLPRHADHQKLVGNMRHDSDFPPPSAEDMAVWTEKEAQYERRMNGVSTEGEVEGEEEGEEHIPAKPPSAKADCARHFQSFWTQYPKKTGKGDAEKSFARALKKADAGIIMAGLAVHLPAWRTYEPRFIPNPATWLNQERWQDDPPEPNAEGYRPDPEAEAEYLSRRISEVAG